VTTVSKVQVRSQAEIEREELERQQRLARALQLQHAEAVSPIQTGAVAEEPVVQAGNPLGGAQLGGAPLGGNPLELDPARGPAPAPFVRPVPKVGRNEMCPCGSGKKYKHCHGALQQASG